MRISTIGVLLLACSSAAASPAGSKAANARGMALMGKKKWAEAAEEFKKAVAEDPSSVKAHYNLASAASRAHDMETAVWEVVWVGDRAAWDDEAKAAQKKAPNDDDLTWVLKEWGVDGATWLGRSLGGDAAPMDLFDLEHGQRDSWAGHALPDAERAKVAATLGAAAGAHDDKCAPADAKQGKVFALTVKTDARKDLAQLTIVGSLKEGVALIDAKGVVARSEPLGCTGPGASQDQLATLVWGFGIPDDISIDTPHHTAPLKDHDLLAVSYSTGGRREWQTNLAVFVRRDKQLVKVFEALLTSSDANGAGHVWQTPRGNLVYLAPGDTKKRLFVWDEAAFKFSPQP